MKTIFKATIVVYTASDEVTSKQEMNGKRNAGLNATNKKDVIH